MWDEKIPPCLCERMRVGKRRRDAIVLMRDAPRRRAQKAGWRYGVSIDNDMRDGKVGRCILR